MLSQRASGVWVEETLIPVRRQQEVLALMCAGCVVAAVVLSRPSVIEVVVLALVALVYAVYRIRRAVIFAPGIELGTAADVEPTSRLILRSAILLSPVVVVALLLAVFVPFTAMVVCGLLGGVAISYLASGDIKRLEETYDVVLARRTPKSMRPRRRSADVHVIVPLDPGRVEELRRQGIAA